MGKQSFDRLDPVRILRNRSQRPALRPGAVAYSRFLYIAVQGSACAQAQLGGPLNSVHCWRQLRQLNELPTVGRHKQSVIRLERTVKLAKGCHLVGRVKKQNLAQSRV